MLFYLFFAFTSLSTSLEINTPKRVWNNSDSNLETCTCYNISGDGVARVIQSNYSEKSNTERLVIYFYKKSSTNQIYMYAPKEEKQNSFPELSLDDGDELTLIDSESLSDLVIRNTNRFIINDQISNVTRKAVNSETQTALENKEEDESGVSYKRELYSLAPGSINDPLSEFNDASRPRRRNRRHHQVTGDRPKGNRHHHSKNKIPHNTITTSTQCQPSENSDNKQNIIEALKTLLYSLQHDEIRDDNAYENEDDSHEIRIIGGVAATGSGTPLNSKGRTGLVDKQKN